MRIAMALLTVGLALGTGCKKKDTSGEAPGSGSAVVGSGADVGSAAVGSGSDVAPTVAGSGSDMGSGSAVVDEKMSRKGGNCPSTVFGSTTKAELKDGKVLVTITADDKDAIAAIQKRSEEVLKAKTDGGPAGQGHDQNGMHGGGVGLCPVHIADGATAEVKNDAKGVVVTITPKDKPEALKAEVDARITKAADFVKENVKAGDKGTMGGVGGGSGDHGMNHSGEGDGKGADRGSGAGKGDGKGGGKGTGGGGGAGTGSGSGAGSAAKK